MSRASMAVAAAALACACAASADDASPGRLSWLPGCWKSENGEPGSGEHWMPLAGGSLLGMSRTVRDGRTVAYEFMRIANGADGKLTFFAQPSGKPPGSFTLKTLAANEVVFENPEHDFPQRVIYRYEPPSRLKASIEGLRNGVPRSIEFPMVRTVCDPQKPEVPGN